MNGADSTVVRAPRSPSLGEEPLKRAIARAVWTEIHWLMPVDRPVTIAVDGDAIAVEFGPPKPAATPCSTDRRRP